jgi:hypothetical protein
MSLVSMHALALLTDLSLLDLEKTTDMLKSSRSALVASALASKVAVFGILNYRSETLEKLHWKNFTGE